LALLSVCTDRRLSKKRRYRRIIYVYPGGGVMEVRDEGVCTLREIFVWRPEKCRWAVVSIEGKFLVIDLFDLHVAAGDVLGVDGDEWFLGDHWLFDNEDAAIAAAVFKS